MKIVFDIETVGYEFENLDESRREFILRYAEKEKNEVARTEKIEEAIRYLNLYPFTAKICSIGMLNTQTENSLILFEGEENDEWTGEDKNVSYKSLPEGKILNTFWEYVKKAEKVISFNGRSFDIPFLMMRSAILKIKPTRNFLGSRYSSKYHIDLLEKLTFHGMMKKFNLDFYCRSFGIDSPKSKGITGMEINELYRAGRRNDIAVYCSEDVKATYELYKIWKDYLDL